MQIDKITIKIFKQLKKLNKILKIKENFIIDKQYNKFYEQQIINLNYNNIKQKLF